MSTPDYSKWHWACIIRELVRLCPDIEARCHANVHCIKKDALGEECFRGSFHYQATTLAKFCINNHSSNDQLMILVAEMMERTKKLIP